MSRRKLARFDQRAAHAAIRAGVKPEHMNHALADLAGSLRGLFGKRLAKLPFDDVPDDVMQGHFDQSYRGVYPDRVEPRPPTKDEMKAWRDAFGPTSTPTSPPTEVK